MSTTITGVPYVGTPTTPHVGGDVERFDTVSSLALLKGGNIKTNAGAGAIPHSAAQSLARMWKKHYPMGGKATGCTIDNGIYLEIPYPIYDPDTAASYLMNHLVSHKQSHHHYYMAKALLKIKPTGDTVFLPTYQSQDTQDQRITMTHPGSSANISTRFRLGRVDPHGIYLLFIFGDDFSDDGGAGNSRTMDKHEWLASQFFLEPTLIWALASNRI